jgi:hypothetical protein
MDVAASRGKNTRMPLPASAIDKLSDHSGSYVICITCRECRHAREIDPRTLANILGWNVTLKQACTAAALIEMPGAVVIEVEIRLQSKPRG